MDDDRSDSHQSNDPNYPNYHTIPTIQLSLPEYHFTLLHINGDVYDRGTRHG